MAYEKVLDPRPENLDLFDKPLMVLVDPEEELDTPIFIEVLKKLGEKNILQLRKEIKEKRFKSGSAFLASHLKGNVVYIPLRGSKVTPTSLNAGLRIVDEVLEQDSAYLVYPSKVNRRELVLMIRESDSPIEVILVRDKIDYIFT